MSIAGRPTASLVLATEEALSASATVWLTFAAAAFGSFLAIAFEAYLTRRGSKSFFRLMKEEVSKEMEAIAVDASERSQRLPHEIRLDPPYPTFAWRQLADSPEARRLGEAYEPLAALYREVDAANHRLAQVGTLLGIAATSAVDDVRLEYRNLAQEFSAGANSSVVSAIPAARSALGEGDGG